MTKVVVLLLTLAAGLSACTNGFQTGAPVIDEASQSSSEGSEGEETPRPAPPTTPSPTTTTSTTSTTTTTTSTSTSTTTTTRPPTTTTTTTTSSTTSTSTTTTTLPFTYRALLWEPVRAGSKAWSTFVFDLIRGEASALLNATDFNFFCPNFENLSLDQKINAAGMLISGMTRYESNHNPLARYHESTMGTDPITGQPVYSEGLLQLSYQDIQGYPFCQFDWETDQYLAATDPNKTILQPMTNLDCGVRILARQVSRRGTIILSTGAYWAVIKSNSQYNKLNEISALVQTLDFCKSP